MKRKVVSFVMAAVMTAALAGCGNSSSAGNQEAQPQQGGQTPAQTQEQANANANASALEETQPAQTGDGMVYKVGIVQYVDDASLNQIRKSIESMLIISGETSGITYDFEHYSHNGQADATVLNQIAADLVADEVDIIIPIATPAAMIMQNATEDNQIPVVFSAVSDPVGAGLVASNDAPGANITGTSDAIDTEAIFGLIMAVNPDTDKVGLLYDKSQAGSLQSIADAKAYCDANGIAYVEKTGTTTAEIQAAADALVAEQVDAVFTPQDNTIMTAELAIFEKFIDAKIPHYTGADSFALNGAFCGYGVNYENLGTVTADMAIDILVNGKDPATMPVKTLSDGIITINTETAEAIGLDYSVLEGMGSELRETVTAQEFE